LLAALGVLRVAVTGALMGSLATGAWVLATSLPGTPLPLRVGMAMAAASVDPPKLVEEPPPPPAGSLTLSRLATGERVEIVPFDGHGVPQSEAFATLARFFQPSSGHVVPIDPLLVDLLMRMQRELGGKPLVLVSGHREPGRGTSKKSYHVRGMAADIAVAGVGVQELRRVALAVGAGGVGLYPGFVHVDARDEPYRWVGGRWRARR
jgi:uncharacterized protein YcbK (DUF882 family)